MANEKERIKEILKSMNLPSGRWVLAGSGSMIMQDVLDRPPRDLDIYCAIQTWFSIYRSGGWDVWCTDPDDTQRRCDPPYLYRTINGLEVNVFFEWRKRGVGDINVAFWVHNPVMADGIPCTPIQFMLDWKRETGRSKDIEDIAMIEKFLGQKEK